jgi:hypothetical protein
MDVNYSRWMSKDPDAEPEAIEEEPRRFSLPRPTRSVAASGAMVALIALAGGALAQSIATSEDAASQDPSVGTTTSNGDAGPGAAGIEDSEDAEDTEAAPADNAESDDFATDDSTLADEGTTIDDPEPTGPRVAPRWTLRRELRRARVMPPGPRPHLRPWLGPRHIAEADADDDDDDDDGDEDH